MVAPGLRSDITPEVMIDEFLDLVFYELFDFVPALVWGFLALVVGVGATVVGLVVFSKSVTSGGVLIAVGVLLVGAVLVEWYR